MRYPQGVLVRCEVPWDERERLAEEVFRQEVRLAIGAGFEHVYIFGTAGEGYAVDTERFRVVAEVFADETVGRGVQPQVGVIALSTAAVVERIEVAHQMGFRTFQLSLPCWGALNDREVVTFFRDVCGSFPDSRFLHYNLGRAKRVLTAGDYRRVADAVPNLAATKNTGLTIHEAAALMRQAPEIQHFFSEALFPVGCLYGECSLLASFGPLMPTRTKEYFELGRAGKYERLFPMMAGYVAAIQDFVAVVGPGRIDGAYDKVIVRLTGLDFPLRLLSPYEGCTEEVAAECGRVLRERHGEWLG